MTEFLPENEKEEYEDFNNLLRLKDSIKSGLIKEMLAEEDMNVNNKIIDETNKKKKNKKNNLCFPLQKIHPKSETLKLLMKENQHKIIQKPKKIKSPQEYKDKIINNKKILKVHSKLEKENIENDNSENKMTEIKDTKGDNFNILNDIRTLNKRELTPVTQKQRKFFIKNEIKEKEPKKLNQSEMKSQRKNKIFFYYNDLVIKNKEENIKKEKLNQINDSLFNEINSKIKHIFNNPDIRIEKTIKDFDIFLTDNDIFEYNYDYHIQRALNIFKKGNKFIKQSLHLPKYHNYSPQEILKDLIFKDILSFLSPIEKYIYSKTNKTSLINYMKSKGAESEILLDKYKNQKKEIEKILNKNQNINVTKNNFFNDNRLTQIFNLLNDEKYLEIFNDKTKVPDDNIIFVYKLFFLMIKGTEKLIELKNDIFWEKISTYFINHTNEFNKNDYLLGELIKKILEQKLDFSEEKIQKINWIVDQIDLRQIYPNTFQVISPTTSQFCFIIGYFLEFFGIIGKEWNPLENEYKEIVEKINELIKKINKIGLYIVNLKYKNKFK